MVTENKENTFAVGDMVYLKSGGPKMTVEGINDLPSPYGQPVVYECVWFSGKKRETAQFVGKVLTVVDPDSKDG